MKDFDPLAHLRVTLDSKISDVIARIQASGPVACALLYDATGRFINVITDGDVRRAFLEGHKLDDSACEIDVVKSKTARPKPITASVHSNSAERQELFREHNLRQLILVDDAGAPVSIIDHHAVDHSPSYINRNFTAVVMAVKFRLM